MTLPRDLWFDPSLCFIGGRWLAPAGGEYLPLENPSDGSVLCQIARGQSADIDAAVAAASHAGTGVWGSDDRARTRPDTDTPRAIDPRPFRATGGSGSARCRQAAEAGPR